MNLQVALAGLRSCAVFRSLLGSLCSLVHVATWMMIMMKKMTAKMNNNQMVMVVTATTVRMMMMMMVVVMMMIMMTMMILIQFSPNGKSKQSKSTNV